jgi:hypothetical protein
MGSNTTRPVEEAIQGRSAAGLKLPPNGLLGNCNRTGAGDWIGRSRGDVGNALF